jgi:uncharacterized protein (TIGR00730 family)
LPRLASLCVFCGSSPGRDPRHRAAAERLGRLLGEAGIRLIYGGGHTGLMGALADATLAAGGAVTGVIPGHLVRRELAHERVRLEIVDSMHARKQRMFDLADGFAVLGGGVGTLDETFEIVTWKQRGMHDTPFVVVDTAGYWQRLDEIVAAAIEAGFAAPETRALYRIVATADEALQILTRMPAPTLAADSARL